MRGITKATWFYKSTVLPYVHRDNPMQICTTPASTVLAMLQQYLIHLRFLMLTCVF